MMKCFHGQAKITQPKHGVIYFVFILWILLKSAMDFKFHINHLFEYAQQYELEGLAISHMVSLA